MAKKDLLAAAPVLAAAFLAGTAALYEGLVVRTYRLTTAKWAAGKHLRAVVVADLHSHSFGEEQEELLQRIREQNPDLILLPGDIVDERVAPDAARCFLRGAAALAPTCYVPGNHEYRTRRMPELLAMVRRCGVRVLTNEHTALSTRAGRVLVAGCEDPEKRRWQQTEYCHTAALQKAFRGIGAGGEYTVLLAHRPDFSALYAALGFDLVVSGHAHGGQVRIPGLLNGLYAPNQGLFPKLAGGCYRTAGTNQVVSRGVAVFRGVPRVFNPPEIVVVDIAGTANP